MADKDPNSLYNGIKTLQDNLEAIKSLVDESIENAKSLMSSANDFGGVISKVFKEQMAKYFIPTVQNSLTDAINLIDGDRVPGSLKDLTIFLDSVPLAMIRQEPSVSELASPAVPSDTHLEVPSVEGKVSNEVDEIPMNASYSNGVEEQPVETVEEARRTRHPFDSASKLKEFNEEAWKDSDKGKMEKEWWLNRCVSSNSMNDAMGMAGYSKLEAKKSINRFGKFFIDTDHNDVVDSAYVSSLIKSWGEPNKVLDESEDGLFIYQVVRTSDMGSAIGDDESHLEPQVVCEFNHKEEADAKCIELNNTVLPGEKELFGTEYKVEKKELESL